MLQAIKNELLEVFKFRRVMYAFVSSTLKVRYRRSRLGFIWSTVIPLIQYSTLGIVFSWIFRISDEHFTAYFLSGVLIFNFIGACLGAAPEIFLANENFIKKVHVPKSMFSFQTVLLEAVNLLFTFVPVIVLGLIWGRVHLHVSYLYLLFLVFVTSFMLVGAGLLVGILSVHFRDLKHIFPALVLGLFYGTPILFPRTIIPEKLQFLVTFNPFYYFVESFRMPILDNVWPPLHYTLIVVGFSALLFFSGLVAILNQGNRIVFKL